VLQGEPYSTSGWNTLRERVAHLPEVRIVTTAPVLAVHLDRH
jgi:hypothetical protein